jgi:hypothetical protein
MLEYSAIQYNYCCVCLFLCRSSGDDNKMLVCDICDKGYHFYCLKPPVVTVPKDGWKCEVGISRVLSSYSTVLFTVLIGPGYHKHKS